MKRTMLNQMIVLYVGLIGGLVTIAWGQESSGHRIENIAFLEQQFDKIQWTEDNDNQISDVALIKQYPNASKNSVSVHIGREGTVNTRATTEQPLQFDSIDVQIPANTGKSLNAVKGMFPITLPNFKRIQLEIDYHVFVNEGEKSSPAEFYVEVFERKDATSGFWVKTGEIRESESKRTAENQQMLEVYDTKTGSKDRLLWHVYNANLSQWAGKEVMIALTAAATDAQNPIRGRWVQTRLVGSTFDYKITPALDENTGGQK